MQKHKKVDMFGVVKYSEKKTKQPKKIFLFENYILKFLAMK